jgi:hypothetical protein
VARRKTGETDDGKRTAVNIKAQGPLGPAHALKTARVSLTPLGMTIFRVLASFSSKPVCAAIRKVIHNCSAYFRKQKQQGLKAKK